MVDARKGPAWDYESAAPTYAHRYLRDHVANFLSTLPRGSRILEAGCGNGSFCGELQTLGYEVCGFDISETGVRVAQQGFAGRCHIEVASVYDDLKEKFGGDFDAVISLEVIEHLYDPRAFLRRMDEVLRPGGKLIISAPYHGYWKNLAIAALGKSDSHFEACETGGHIKFWSRRTLAEVLTREGYLVREFRGAGRVPLFWKSGVQVAEKRAGETARCA